MFIAVRSGLFWRYAVPLVSSARYLAVGQKDDSVSRNPVESSLNDYPIVNYYLRVFLPYNLGGICADQILAILAQCTDN